MVNLLEIDLSKPQRALSEYLGTEVKLTSTVYDGIENKRIYLTSQELKEHSGLMAKLYKTLTIGSNYCSVQDNDELGEIIYFPLNFWYTFESGGSNGAKIGSFVYVITTGKWISYLDDNKGKIL